MKIALLGVDAEMLAVARALLQTGRHQIAGLYSDEHEAAAVASLAFQVPISSSWESLLTGQVADLVLVACAADEDILANQLRKLVQADVPLVVSHPILQSMLVCYELDMIRQDTRSPIWPYRPWLWHPAVLQLESQLASGLDSPIGVVEQLAIERQAADRSDRAVLAHFARDVDLARHLSGELTKLSALCPPTAQARLANLGVQLSGPEGALVRWSIRPAEDCLGAHFTFSGSQGHITLIMPDDDAPWTLEIFANGQTTIETYAEAEPATGFVDHLDSISLDEPADGAEWLSAARSIELTETIDRSLAKGRTIELYDEDYSEETTFKGTMAALGCGVLLLALLALFLSAVVTGLGIPLLGAWPYLLLAILAVFLLLQGLRFVFPSDK